MPLTVGSRVGPYEVVSAVGMGEVYKARDTKLNRDVALNVLPDLFAVRSLTSPASSTAAGSWSL